MCNKVCAVMKKELGQYFSSPVALIFLGVFLMSSMFIFFWVESFFARNMADIRPLFEWMPILMIFLVSALTMRSWSEERRTGTLELLLTSPISPYQLVLGKFFACLTLVSIAIALTFVLPFAVSQMGSLDFGPVLGGYLATVFLAAAYIAIGLFVSSKTENQIVSLFLSIAICYALYLLGSNAIAPLLDGKAVELFKLLGSGSRFDSICRGVLDFRDFYYYISISAIFLVLNVLTLKSFGWAEVKSKHHKLLTSAAILLVLNFFAANFWLNSLTGLRTDLTAGKMYTISSATKQILAEIQEPLLIRGYFSSKTHPLLSPLVPQVRDMLKEYELAGNGLVRSEFVDPKENQEIETEAAEKYNIKAIPFQVEGKNEMALVNSYFYILVKYADKHEVLGFSDLIEVKPNFSNGQTEIQLKNLEYDITRAIKKVLHGFQGVDAVFATLKKPVEFVGYISRDEILPEKLKTFEGEIKTIVEELRGKSGGKLTVAYKEPEANNGAVAREIREKYQFNPMISSLFNPQPYYFYMVIHDGENAVQIPLPSGLSANSARQTIEAALKRFSPGFLKTVGLLTPPEPAPQQNPMLQRFMQNQARHFNALAAKLAQNYNLEPLDLRDGIVPENVDILLIVAPDKLTTKQLFAVDQFLMRGGTVVLATSPRSVGQSFDAMQMNNGLVVQPKQSGVEAWLARYGISMIDKFVLDPRCDKYVVPNIKQGQMQIELKDVPYLISIRGDGFNEECPMVRGFNQLSFGWASPIMLDKKLVEGRKVTEMLFSSKDSWNSSTSSIIFDYKNNPRFGVLPEPLRSKQLLGVMLEGQFDSFFKGKESPLLTGGSETKEGAEKEPEVFGGQIDRSPESARIVVFASNEFITDETLQLYASINGSSYINGLQLIENVIDWSLDDPVLVTLRGRERFARTLEPMSEDGRFFWEYIVCYGGSLLGLILVFAVYRIRRKIKAAAWKQYA